MVEHGAIHSLCLQLGFVLNKDKSSDSEELQGICTLIHVLCQCRDSLRERVMLQIGIDLNALLVRVLEQSNRSETMNEKTVQSILCTWHIAAASSEGSTRLLQCQGLVGAIVDVLKMERDSTLILAEAIGIIKHMTYFAEDYRMHLLEFPNLTPTLCQLPFSALPEMTSERLSAVFRNLACTSQARLAMVDQSIVLAAIVQLCKGQSRRMRRNLLSTLDSLAMEPDSAMPMVLFGDGLVLNVLMIFLAEKEDDTTRRRAARALRLLARDKTAALLSRVPALLERLADAALHDPSREVRVDVAEAFANCAAYIRAPMPSHDATLSSLTQLSSGPVPDAVAKAFKEQAMVPDNRPKMAENVDLLSALAELALRDHASNSSKEDVANALFQLSNDDGNREKMTTEPVLKTLVRTCQQGDIRELAITALLNLATVEASRKRMVSHPGLLNALVQFAASSSSCPSLKKDVKKAIMMLVPLL
jgi:hypothetical protein